MACVDLMLVDGRVAAVDLVLVCVNNHAVLSLLRLMGRREVIKIQRLRFVLVASQVEDFGG